MPRKLPWEDNAAPAGRSSKSAGTPTPKRQKVGDKRNDRTPSPTRNAEGRAPSSSPPPEAAKEEFMNDGMECDDKWRMVEDEFLAVAKKFTVHLHAAEYKRQQKVVKTRNAETINSISRPVTGKMPDHTKRRMEAAARVRIQRAALQGMVIEKAEADDDSDDGDGLPYFGTTLHGLMDSPRKKAASLAKPGTIAATTRAAAGFKQSAAQSKPDRESPQSKIALRTARTIPPDDIATESSEDDDDLDAPILAPKLNALVRKPVPVTSSDSGVKSSTTVIKTTKSFPLPKSSSLSFAKSNSFGVVESKPSHSRLSSEFRSRPSRLEQAQRQKAKREKEQKEKQRLDVIPTFL